MHTMFFNAILLWQRVYPQWQASSVSKGYFFKLLSNLWPSDKPLSAKSTTYRNFSILEKEDVDHILDKELTAVPTIDQEITVVDSKTIDEQDDDIRVAEIDQQMLFDFLDRNRRAQATDSLPSEVRHYSAKQLFRMRLPDDIVIDSTLSIPKLWSCRWWRLHEGRHEFQFQHWPYHLDHRPC